MQHQDKPYITIKNNNLNHPIIHNDVTIYGMGEVTKSKIGYKSIIGDYSRIRGCDFGNHVRIDRNNYIQGTSISDYSYTGPFDMIFDCIIGKFSSISYGVTIGPPEHDYTLVSTHPFIYDKYYDVIEEKDLLQNEKLVRPLLIGNDVWIGCNSTILRGISIGDGAVVGANSLVNKNVPPYAIVVGSPAQIIKYRFPKHIVEVLCQIKWWNLDIEIIKNNPELFKNKPNIKELKKLL